MENKTVLNSSNGIFGPPQMIMKLEITAEYQAENDKKGQMTPALEMSLSDADPMGILYAAIFQNLEALKDETVLTDVDVKILFDEIKELKNEIKQLKGEK